MNVRRHKRTRRGNIIVLTMLLMVLLCAMVAFSVDVGYLYMVRAELQRSADAAAVAATWELLDEEALTGSSYPCHLIYNAQATAHQFVNLNHVGGDAPALGQGDITVGYMSSPSDPECVLDANYPSSYNAVEVRVQRNAQMNGEIPLFFARVMGFDSQSLSAQATAALLTNIGGWTLAEDSDDTIDILPFALDEVTWNGLLNGCGADNWDWDEELERIRPGTDGVLEVNLFPQGTGSPGNRGTVDIGSSNNSTNDIARQILNGVNASDLSYHGGTLELDSNGELELNGDTGISAGVKDELAEIKGEPRIVPIFREVQGPGNNAQYTIVKFVGIRIMDVKLTGQMSSKHVTIQPANMVTRGAIASETSGTSDFVYSPVWLVR